MDDLGVVCLKKNQAVVYEVKISPYQVPEVQRESVEFCLDPVQVAISRFSDENIRQMTPCDLLELTKFSRVFSPQELARFVRLMDLKDLRTTAFLARRFCRQAVNAAYKRWNRQVPFLNE